MTTDNRIPDIVVERADGTVSLYASRPSNGSPTKPALAFEPGDQVRVKGTVEEQLQLYGRLVAGAVGTIVKPTRRSQGRNRYLVHFPRHLYVTPVKRQEHPIEAHETVLREEHIERVPAEERVRTCRVCGCTDEWGCDEGCTWVEEDLCSSCVGAAESEAAHELLLQLSPREGLPLMPAMTGCISEPSKRSPRWFHLVRKSAFPAARCVRKSARFIMR